MADKKISALTSATTPLAGTEVFPLVQGGSTVKTPVSSVVTSGLTASFGDVTATASGVPAITAIRDLDVGVVGAAGQTIALGAKSGTTPTAGADILGILEGGATTGRFAVRTLTSGSMSSKLSVSSAGDVTADLGNVVIGTAGKGIDFSANTHAAGMTSELLNDYEEGTWTPTDGSGAGLGLTVANATYTKIGRLVTANFAITYPATASASTARLGGLPFTSSSAGFSFPMAVSTCQTGICKTGLVDTSATTFLLLDTSASALTNVQMSGLFLRGTVIYEV